MRFNEQPKYGIPGCKLTSDAWVSVFKGLGIALASGVLVNVTSWAATLDLTGPENLIAYTVASALVNMLRKKWFPENPAV